MFRRKKRRKKKQKERRRQLFREGIDFPEVAFVYIVTKFPVFQIQSVTVDFFALTFD